MPEKTKVKVKMASKINILANTEDLKQRWTVAAGVENGAGHKNMLQLIQLRWIAVIGQIITIVFVQLAFRIELPLKPMSAVVACLVALNLISVYRALGGGWELRMQQDQNCAMPITGGAMPGAAHPAPGAPRPNSLPEPARAGLREQPAAPGPGPGPGPGPLPPALPDPRAAAGN